jgi:hypothetical protein
MAQNRGPRVTPRDLVRPTTLSDGQIAELRESVARGAGHECEEWRAERGGTDTGRCALCDAVLPRRQEEGGTHGGPGTDTERQV